MDTILKRVDGVVRQLLELQDAGRLQVLVENVYPKPDAKLVRKAALPPLLRALYAECNGLEIEWESAGVRGRLNIPSIERVARRVGGQSLVRR